mgnify:FL=1
MATSRTDSLIASTGARDYSTVQAWEDDIGVGLGTSTNLITDDYDHYGWLKAEEFDEAEITIGGHTCDATHKIYLAADSNGATTTASQHSRTKTDAALMDDSSRALVYNTSYASILCNNGYAYGLNVTDTYTEVSRLQFKKVAGNLKGVRLAANCVFNRCLLEGYQGGGSYPMFLPVSSVVVYSSIFINVGSVAVSIFDTNAAIINCTVVRSSTASLSSTGKQASVGYSRPDFENCAFFGGGAGTEYIAKNITTPFATLDYNATDFTDLTSLSGEGANNTYSLTQTDQFTAVDNTDWSVKSGHGLGVGTNKTATVAVDIWGVAFETGTSIVGCEQFASAPAGARPQGPFGHPFNGPFGGPI